MSGARGRAILEQEKRAILEQEEELYWSKRKSYTGAIGRVYWSKRKSYTGARGRARYTGEHTGARE